MVHLGAESGASRIHTKLGGYFILVLLVEEHKDCCMITVIGHRAYYPFQKGESI